MMETIFIHSLWWGFGFLCRFCAMGAMAVASEMSRMEEDVLRDAMVAEVDEPEPEPQTNAELAEAIATAEFYKSLYLEEAQRMRV